LLGEIKRGKDQVLVDIVNSFAVPFEEDEVNPAVWFLDHNYLENMGQMYKKVAGEISSSIFFGNLL
jgi:26S proteasome regulatory subunit N8